MTNGEKALELQHCVQTRNCCVTGVKIDWPDGCEDIGHAMIFLANGLVIEANLNDLRMRRLDDPSEG